MTEAEKDQHRVECLSAARAYAEAGDIPSASISAMASAFLAQRLHGARAVEIELERERLAACGVAAHGGDSSCLPEYESDSLTATRRLWATLERVRSVVDKCCIPTEVKELKRALEGKP